MIGAWPLEPDRLIAYMQKAAREAKQQTSWTQQNKDFEDALKGFIDRAYESAEFLAGIEDFVQRILTPGRLNSLAQTLIKCTAPGVPDTYQGSELWDLHLVDPDNRGPVDFANRISLLSEVKAGASVEEILQKMESGMPKLWTLHYGLNLRRQKPAWFGSEAAYEPLAVEGRKSEHAIAYLRAGSVATIVPRWNVKRADNWSGASVTLPGSVWRNVLTQDVLQGGRVPIQSILQRFPVALLVKEEN
jgi:(1->4)-alpha-D-glucan 1-alpha-D-glucosylmutase